VADSRDGAHLLYRIDLPNDDESRELIKGTLETLHTLFSDDQYQVDTSVFNAARIWKLYRTTGRKGDNIPTRPHWKAAILTVPEEIRVVRTVVSRILHRSVFRSLKPGVSCPFPYLPG